MSSKHGFRFSREEIEQQINALYELDDIVIEALAEGEDPSKHDGTTQQLRFYFECLADSLWEAGVFKSRQEARGFIRADIDVLQHAGGPGGLRPDDGILNPGEIAQGIVALRNLNEFIFQVPVCFSSPLVDVDYTTHAGGMNFRLTSNYTDLSLVKMHPDLRADKKSENYLWIEGSVKTHRYDVAKVEIDLMLVSAMAMMEVVGLLRYTAWPRPGSKLSIGTKDHVNSGAYYDMQSSSGIAALNWVM